MFVLCHGLAALAALAKAFRRLTLANTTRMAKKTDSDCFFIRLPSTGKIRAESDPLEVEPKLEQCGKPSRWPDSSHLHKTV